MNHRCINSRFWLPAATLVCLFCLPSTTPSATADDVDDLIQQLGDESYIVRSSAAERLKQIGLRAFDRLYKAQYHPKIDIGMSARRLVSNLTVSWSVPGDTKDVREALQGYSQQSENGRRNRIELLAGLPDRSGALAIARLVRYETSARLSAMAAMAIMQQIPSDDPARRAVLAAEIKSLMGDADRFAAKWLVLYADDLANNQFGAEAWHRFIDERRELVDSAATDQSTRDSVLDMVKVVAAHGGRMEAKPAAVELVMKHLDMIPPQTDPLIEISTWAIDHDLYGVVDKLRDRFKPFFAKSPMLSYAAAEAAIRQGDDATGQRLADNALKLPEIPPKNEIEAIQPRELQIILLRHSVTADRLKSRGLYRWSLREYQSVIDAVPLDNDTATMCRAEAASLLSELKDHEKVIELLQPLVDRLEKDRELRQVTALFRQYQGISGLLEYHRGELLIQQKEIELGCKTLRAAYQTDPDNIDILIRMYHIDHDEKWRLEIAELVQAKIREFELLIAQSSGGANLRMFNGGADPEDHFNNYAWLVSNTEGDFEKALKYSLRAVRQTDPGDVMASAARMDTCARCYFALEQYDQAIAMQQRAITRMPHSPPLQRQLKVFEKARDEKSKS